MLRQVMTRRHALGGLLLLSSLVFLCTSCDLSTSLACMGSNSCWCQLHCPEGYARTGDGSACHRDSDGASCDLGYCAGVPNPGREPCPVGS